MKTCVFVTGRVKTWQKNLPHFKKQLENYDYEVHASLNCELDDSDAIQLSEQSFVTDVICQPTLYPEWLKDYETNCMEHQKFNFFSQCFHRYLVFQESKKINVYDRYIFTRMDIINDKSLPLVDFANSTVYCPNSHMHGFRHVLVDDMKMYFDEKLELINDQILICNFEGASSIANLYLEFVNMYIYENIWWHPETMLYEHLQKRNIKIETFDFDYILDPERNKPSE